MLGGVDQLAEIISREKVESIVIATRLEEETRRRLRKIADAAEVRVSEWHFAFHHREISGLHGGLDARL